MKKVSRNSDIEKFESLLNSDLVKGDWLFPESSKWVLDMTFENKTFIGSITGGAFSCSVFKNCIFNEFVFRSTCLDYCVFESCKFNSCQFLNCSTDGLTLT